MKKRGKEREMVLSVNAVHGAHNNRVRISSDRIAMPIQAKIIQISSVFLFYSWASSAASCFKKFKVSGFLRWKKKGGII